MFRADFFFFAAGMVHPYDKNMCRPPAAEVEHSQLAASWTGPDQCGDRRCGKNRIGSHIHWENGDLTTRKMVILCWFNSDLMGFIYPLGIEQFAIEHGHRNS